MEISLILMAADHDSDNHESNCQRTELISLKGKTSAISLSCAIDDYGDKVLMAGIGVQGYQEMNGQMWALADRCVFEIVGAWAG
jgi:hypothetical protein